MGQRPVRPRPTRRTNAALLVGAALILAALFPAHAFAGLNQWTTNGPEGGFLHTIAVSPDFATDNTIFVGAGVSGVWKSTNRGTTWTPTAALTNHYIYSVAVSPNFGSGTGHDQVVLVGTQHGDLFESTNGGASWNQVTSFTSSDIRSIAFSPDYLNDHRILVGTTGDGVYESTNYGATWTQRIVGLTNQSVSSVAFSPDYASDRTVVAGTGAGVFVSTSYPTIGWSQENTNLGNLSVNSVAISPDYAADDAILAGTNDGVYMSTAAGTPNWSRKDDSNFTNTTVHVVAFSPNYGRTNANGTDQTILVGTNGGYACTSADRGTSWTRHTSGLTSGYVLTAAFSPNYDPNAVHPLEPMFLGIYGGVFSSTDGGANWAWKNNGLKNIPIYAIAFTPDDPSGETLYAGADGDGVFKTTDGGLSWTLKKSGMSIRSIGVPPNYPNALPFAGTALGVYEAMNAQATQWNPMNAGLPSDPVWSIALSPNYDGTIDRTLYAGTEGGAFESTDGATSWHTANLANHVWSIAVSPNYATDHTLFAGTYGQGVHVSHNQGATWSQVSTGLGNLDVRAIALSPTYSWGGTDETLFAGTNGGVFESANSGGLWTQRNIGLTNTWIRSLALSPNYPSDHTLLAGTYGDGAFRSIDGAQTWTQINNGLAHRDVRALGFSPNYANIKNMYAGTYCGGVYKFTAPPTTAVLTDPFTANGYNSWFITTCTITFVPDVPASTFYQWDSTTGIWTPYMPANPPTAPEGVHTLYYYSVDASGNAESVQSQVFMVDTILPTASISSPTQGGSVSGVVAIQGSALDANAGSNPWPHDNFLRYELQYGSGYRPLASALQAPLVPLRYGTWWRTISSSTTSVSAGALASWDTSNCDNSHHTLRLIVEDQAGNKSTRLRAVSVNNPGRNWLDEVTSDSFDCVPEYRPDGAKIAFASDRLGTYDLWSMNTNGTGTALLERSSSSDLHPSYDPTSTFVAFASDRSGAFEIWTIPANTGLASQVTTAPGTKYFPTWTPDGRIVYASDEAGGINHIFIINPNGTGRTQLTFGNASDIRPDVSPDGSMIAYDSTSGGSSSIWVMDVSTGISQQIVTLPGAGHPSFSPDGQKLVFQSGRGDTNADVWVVNVNGTNLQRLAHDADPENIPSWSHLGTNSVVFNSGKSGLVDIYSMNDDGTGRQRLTQSIDDFIPDVSSDASHIAFSSNRARNYSTITYANRVADVYLVDPNGANLAPVTDLSFYSHHPSFNATGTEIAFTSDRAGSHDVWKMDISGFPVTQLTSVLSTESVPTWGSSGVIVYDSDLAVGDDDIWIMNDDGSQQSRLTTSTLTERYPDVTASGTRVAFSGRGTGVMADRQDVWAMNADGSGQIQLTNDPSVEEWHPSYSPSGGRISYTRDNDLYSMSSNGANSMRLTYDQAVDNVQTWGADGTTMVFATSRTIGAGGGAKTIWKMTLPPDTTPPTAPASARAYACNESSIEITWTASTDAMGVDHYTVHDASTNASIGTTTGTSYVDTGLSQSTSRSYYVKASDSEANVSGPSPSVTATTYASGTTASNASTETVSLGNDVGVEFHAVGTPGVTTIDVAPESTVVMPSGFNLAGFVYDVTTTAGYTPPINVTIPYDPNAVTDPSSLRLLHWDDTLSPARWVDCTVSVDTANQTITGQVNHLSPFMPAEPSGPPAPIPDASEWAMIILAFGGAAVLVSSGIRKRGGVWRREI